VILVSLLLIEEVVVSISLLFFYKNDILFIVLTYFYMTQIIKEDTLVGDILKEWTIQEYEKHDRGILWYIIMGGFGIGFVK